MQANSKMSDLKSQHQWSFRTQLGEGDCSLRIESSTIPTKWHPVHQLSHYLLLQSSNVRVQLRKLTRKHLHLDSKIQFSRRLMDGK